MPAPAAARFMITKGLGCFELRRPRIFVIMTDAGWGLLGAGFLWLEGCGAPVVCRRRVASGDRNAVDGPLTPKEGGRWTIDHLQAGLTGASWGLWGRGYQPREA